MMPQPSQISQLVSDAGKIWMAGLDAVQPYNLFDRIMLERVASASGKRTNDARYFVVGCGKAALAMSSAFVATAIANEDVIDPALLSGVITVPHGYRMTLPAEYSESSAIAVLEAGHPLPDNASVVAVEETIDYLKSAQLTDRDCVVVLLSGGGSANWGAPVEGLTLEELNAFTTACLRSNVDIIVMNSIRRLLTRFGGGGLLDYTGPARVVSIILSDVPGTDLGFVASGPTHPIQPHALTSRQLDALDLPQSVRDLVVDRSAIERRGPDEVGQPVEHLLLADNRTALNAALRFADSLGYETPSVLELKGEARISGEYVAKLSLSCPVRSSFVVVAGGETTVTVRGNGLGGRNQEVALSAASILAGSHRDIALLCAGTDGVDGPTQAAGGISTNQTLSEMSKRGINITDVLGRNDSYRAMSETETLLITGPTHTNTMDLAVAVVAQEAK